MNIASKIKGLALERGAGRTIARVEVGLRYGAVMLDNGATGVAFSFLARGAKNCAVQENTLVGKRASDLLSDMGAKDRVKSSLALATANALFNTDSQEHLQGDILSHIKIDPDDLVVMVGHFRPLVPELKSIAKEIAIFEENPDTGAGILPASEAPKYLAKCQVALITATAIINGTIDSLLSHCSSCREVAILGPSTPLIATAFFSLPVTLLSGIVVDDGPGILQVVKEGGGTRLIRRFSHKVNVRVR